MKKTIITALAAILITAAACQTTTAKTDLGFIEDIIYESLETYLGTPTNNYYLTNYPVSRNRELNDIIVAIANNINNQSKNKRGKDIAILTDDTINAFAVPGGHIFLHFGLMSMMDSKDEIACVIAHETGHLEKRHSLKGFIYAFGLDAITRTLYSRNEQQMQYMQLQYLAYLSTMKLSREDEFEADALAMEYVVKAGYNPQGCLNMMTKFIRMERRNRRQPTPEDSHPPSTERLARMQDWLKTNNVELKEDKNSNKNKESRSERRKRRRNRD